MIQRKIRMGFIDKIIEKIEIKIQKTKKKREQKELIKNFKNHLEKPLDGCFWYATEKLLNFYNIPEEVRHPQCEFLFDKLFVRCLKVEFHEGVGKVYLLKVLKDNLNENR